MIYSSLNHFAAWIILEKAAEAIFAFLTETFGSYVLRERQGFKIRVEIDFFEQKDNPESKRRLSEMFGAIENKKRVLQIQDYSIAQTSLEQIFNFFASQVQCE
jgi:hypothetical protein